MIWVHPALLPTTMRVMKESRMLSKWNLELIHAWGVDTT